MKKMIRDRGKPWHQVTRVRTAIRRFIDGKATLEDMNMLRFRDLLMETPNGPQLPYSVTEKFFQDKGEIIIPPSLERAVTGMRVADKELAIRCAKQKAKNIKRKGSEHAGR